MSSTQLVFATGNQAKLAQLAYVIAALRLPVRLVSARERYGDQARYEEIGQTASLIAWRGAATVAERIGVPVVVEDTTFHVDALDGAPGIYSGKYLKEYGRVGILDTLGDTPNRSAKIVSAVAWAAPGGDSQTWVTVVEGHITDRERVMERPPEWVGPSPGKPLGGGFNSIFVPVGQRQTLAETSAQRALHAGYREPNFCGLLYFVRSRADQ